MQKIDKKTADAYFRTRTTLIIIYLAIGFCVSYGVVLFAEPLSSITFLNMPLHYYMGAQGAVLTFIFLLFVNAIVSDFVDKKFGLLDLDKEDKEENVVNK